MKTSNVKVCFENADFWLIRSSCIEQVGQPVLTYNEDYIGIKVIRTDIIVPKFLYYSLTHLHNKGVFKLIARGSLNLVHIRVEDIKNVPLIFR